MISEFQGQYRFLSNFWPAVVILDDIYYPSVEHAYQAAKTTHLGWRLYISESPTPGIAKKRAREIPRECLRHDWNIVKQDIMFDILQQKFSFGKLREQLLATGEDELVEGNTWGDAFWGVCNGKGKNMLGRMFNEDKRRDC